MKASVKARWIEALRSGKYQQAAHTLRKPDSNEFCCLGVLCEIEGMDWAKDSSGFYKASQSVTPTPVRQANLSAQQAHRLADMNDAGRSFEEIADYIEREIPPLLSADKGDQG